MSWRSSATQLVTGKWVSSKYAGHGITGAAIKANTSTGANGQGIFVDDWDDASDDPKEFRASAVSGLPAGGSLDEDGILVLPAGTPDGTYSIQYTLLVDGVNRGTATETVQIGVSDSTAPVLTGSLTVGTVTSASIQISWPAATDNVAVVAYETSTDGTTWTSRGNVLTYTFTGLAASTSYTLRVRAKDGAGNVSAVLSVVQATPAATDTTVPVMTGALASSLVTTTTYTLNGWGATDNIGVTGFELSLDGGTTYIDIGNVTSWAVTGRTAGATDQVRVRAYDAAGNRSTALSTSVTLVANAPAPVPAPPPPAPAPAPAPIAAGTARIALTSTGQIVVLIP